MSRATLIRLLAIEFMHDPAFKYMQVLDDVAVLSNTWLAGKGRHYPLEEASQQFSSWWRSKLSECMKVDGTKISYTEFMANFIALARA